MELLDKQLQCSLHGNFEKGWKMCQELEEQVITAKAQLHMDIQEACVKFKQFEEKGINCVRANYNRGWYKN